MKILRRTGLLGERDPRRRGKMTGKGKSAREEESSSDSDDDVDVVAAAPTGYRFFEVDDKWPPAARYERPSTAAVPPISAPHSVTQLQQVWAYL
eukprot:496535-Rhodomonas_salina.6